MLKIMSLPVDMGGCGWYRVRQPFEMIKRFTPHDTHIIDGNKDDMVAVTQALGIANVVVIRPGAEMGYWQMKDIPEFKHLKWVLDIDDNVELISPYSKHYDEYGLEEYYDEWLGKWLWKDGEGKFNIKRNRERVARHLEVYSKVDMITVTTPKLAEYAKQYNDNVVILPNFVNMERWWKLPFKPNKMKRVGWSGGISHYEDWYSIKKELNEVMREHPFKLIMAGQNFKGIVDEDNRHLVETFDWMPFKGHSYRMMCTNLDFAIVPLADLPFNHYKSPIKILEMGAMGITSIVANVEPYASIVEDCDGFLPYQSATSFRNTLLRALETVTPQVASAKKVHKYVKNKHDAKSNVDLWVNAYQSLV